MKISIIIPIYNKSKYIKTILQQLKDQSFSDFECLLIDDGSSDGSEVICDDFAALDARLKVFHIPNGGVSHARNVGLDHAQGDYITFIDSDDEILPNYLENLYAAIEKSKADIIISGHLKFWDNKDDTISIKHPHINGLVTLRECICDFASVQRDSGLFGYCWSKAFKNHIVHNIRFDEGLRLAEDFDFCLRTYEKAGNIYFDDQCLYRYRQEADNSTAIVKDDKIDYFAQLKINLRYRDFLKRANAYDGENKKILEQLLSNYLYFSAFYCPSAIMDERFLELTELQKREGIKFVSGRSLQRIVLSLTAKGHWKTAKNMIKLYRSLRNMIRKS
ncbi:MAG: glycosyltransferase [Ruminococcaceae bacterium]|nr:glycosyltransferase [Oscillospiraceae bacterium]